jgi:hypothetical protein
MGEKFKGTKFKCNSEFVYVAQNVYLQASSVPGRSPARIKAPLGPARLRKYWHLPDLFERELFGFTVVSLCVLAQSCSLLHTYMRPFAFCNP